MELGDLVRITGSGHRLVFQVVEVRAGTGDGEWAALRPCDSETTVLRYVSVTRLEPG